MTLDLLRRRSVARCEDRWLAAGLAPEDAAAMAKDESLPSIDPALAPSEQAPLRVIVAEVGAGKSLIGERLFQRAVTQRERRADAPVPCWLRVRDVGNNLEAHVEALTRPYGDMYQHGLFLVLDGADEPGTAKAADILSEARQLVRVVPAARILLSTRPLTPFATAFEAVQVQQLHESDAHAIIGRISGRDITVGVAAGWPASLRQAIRRPLFAVLLGVHLRRRGTVRVVAPAELLREVIEGALQGHQTTARDALRRVAVKVIAARGSSLPRAEIGALEALDALSDTRLVSVSEDRVSFPLILIAQWFAAESLALDEVSMASLLNAPEDLEDWRYPLALVVGAFGEAHSTRVMAALAERHPGFASQIVQEAVRRWGLDGLSEYDPMLAGERIRRATQAWVTGIGPLAELCAPLTDRGELAALGVHGGESMLTTGWKISGNQQPPVQPLPGGFGFFLGDEDSAQDPWPIVRGARPTEQPSWPWRWSLEGLSGQLENLLKRRRLPLLDSPMRALSLWRGAHTLGLLADDGSFELQQYFEQLPPDADELVVHPSGISIRVQAHRAAVLELQSKGTSRLDAPLAPRDAEFHGGWIWNAWTREGTLKRTQQCFELALQTFEWLARGPFVQLSPWMNTAATLPAVARVSLTLSEDEGFGAGPIYNLLWEPLPKHSPSRVEIVEGGNDPRTWDRELELRWVQNLREQRPEAARWISSTWTSALLEVFDDAAPQELAYKWLWADLQRLGWVSGMLGQAPSHRELLL